MAFSTYSGLVTAIAAWLARDDLSTQIPDFIELAELRIERELRVREIIVGAVDTVSEQVIAAPPGFVEAYLFTIESTSSIPLEYRPIDDAERRNAGVTSGVPRYFSVVGSEIWLYPAPDGEYTYSLYYYSRFDPISTTNPTNVPFALAPDLYLAGALAEAYRYLLEEERASYWSNQFDATIKKLHAAEQRAHRTSAPRRARVLA